MGKIHVSARSQFSFTYILLQRSDVHIELFNKAFQSLKDKAWYEVWQSPIRNFPTFPFKIKNMRHMYTCMWSGKNFSVTAVPKYFEDILFLFLFSFSFGSARDWTQHLVHAGWVLYHCATPPILFRAFFIFKFGMLNMYSPRVIMRMKWENPWNAFNPM